MRTVNIYGVIILVVNVWGDVSVRMSGHDVACPCCGIVLELNKLPDHLYDDHSPNELVGSLWQSAYYNSKRSRFMLD